MDESATNKEMVKKVELPTYPMKGSRERAQT
jgi:hypothetical protein